VLDDADIDPDAPVAGGNELNFGKKKKKKSKEAGEGEAEPVVDKKVGFTRAASSSRISNSRTILNALLESGKERGRGRGRSWDTRRGTCGTRRRR
jgi:hypothetical protein